MAENTENTCNKSADHMDGGSFFLGLLIGMGLLVLGLVLQHEALQSMKYTEVNYRVDVVGGYVNLKCMEPIQ